MRIRKRKRKRIYDDKALNALVYLWRDSDYLCGKRLKVYLDETIHILKRFNEFKFDEETEKKLKELREVSFSHKRL